MKESASQFIFQNTCHACGNACCTREVIFAADNELAALNVDAIEHKPDKTCMFLENGRCSVYEKRPLECKIFPFDIEEIGKNLMWIVWEFCPASPLLNDVQSLDYFENELLVHYSLDYLYNYIDYHRDTEPNYAGVTFKVLRKVHLRGEPVLAKLSRD